MDRGRGKREATARQRERVFEGNGKIATTTRSDPRRERWRSKGIRENETVERIGRSGKGGILEPGPALKYTPREMPGVN